MVRKIFILGVVSMLLCPFMLIGCKDREREAVGLPLELFHDGDLVFRRGTGLTSRVVLAADEKGVYSHVGILKQMDGKWCVIHAVPGEPDYKGDEDRVKMEPIEKFFSKERASKGAVIRVEGETKCATKAAENAFLLFKAGILFDHEYDLTDTMKMYCTELIDHVYKKEGIDLSEGRLSRINMPLLSGDYLLPNDIAQSQKLRLIYIF